MSSYRTLTSPAIPLLRDDIDTDLIAPALWRGPANSRAFASLRFEGRGVIKAASIFDRPPFDRAAILIVGSNFGLGTRVHDACAALAAQGIACLVGVSFARPFADRAIASGLVLLTLDYDAAALLADDAIEGDAITVDLAAPRITTSFGEHFSASQAAPRPAQLSGRQLAKAGGGDAEKPHLFYAGRA
jgi:3-isopropylmalate/(R)-2-methylmalate dehydratase small subunit